MLLTLIILNFSAFFYDKNNKIESVLYDFQSGIKSAESYIPMVKSFIDDIASKIITHYL